MLRRLGFLMESCGIDAPPEIQRLRQELTAPTISWIRNYPRWRLRLNVTPEELEAARSV